MCPVCFVDTLILNQNFALEAIVINYAPHLNSSFALKKKIFTPNSEMKMREAAKLCLLLTQFWVGVCLKIPLSIGELML